MPKLLPTLAAISALAGSLAPARAGAELSPARADLAIAQADRASELGPVIADEAAALANWMSRASSALGEVLAVAELSEDAVPVLTRGTDRRTVQLLMLPRDGELDERQEARLESLVTCARTGRTGEVSPGLVAILADLAETFPGQPIELVSGYRAPPDGAPSSKHFHGHAVDIRVPGVPVEEVRDHLWLTHTSIGLGYYPRQGFVHIDYRPNEPDIAWTAAHEGAAYKYHPRWARALRADREPQSRVGL